MTNKITIVGRLAADIETKTAGDGTPMGNFTVASDIGYGAKKSTNWFRCTLYGKRVDSVAQFLTKGQQVTIFGSLTLREWQNKDGVKQLSPDVWVDDFALQGGKQSSDSQPASKPIKSRDGERTPQPFEDDSDIPF